MSNLYKVRVEDGTGQLVFEEQVRTFGKLLNLQHRLNTNRLWVADLAFGELLIFGPYDEDEARQQALQSASGWPITNLYEVQWPAIFAREVKDGPTPAPKPPEQDSTKPYQGIILIIEDKAYTFGGIPQGLYSCPVAVDMEGDTAVFDHSKIVRLDPVQARPAEMARLVLIKAALETAETSQL